MTAFHQRPVSSSSTKKPFAKTNRLPLSSPKRAKAGKRRSVEVAADQAKNDEDDMAASFLQYCAMCERQIVVPNNSILYCSESCRRKDSQNSLSTMLPPASPTFCIEAEPVANRTIVPRRKPTTIASYGSIPSVLHDAKADLDPTEWKPDSPGRSSFFRPRSEACDYLSQFHRSGPSLGSRPTASMMSRTAPSLSHTPTTSATSAASSVLGTPENSSPHVAHRPAIVWPSAPTSVPTRSVGPMAPAVKCAATVHSSGVHGSGDVLYARKAVPAASAEEVAGSLKRLLAGTYGTI